MSDWLLGPPGRGRGAVKLTLLALGVYALFCLSVVLQVQIGLMRREPALWLCGVSIAGIAGFYLLLRSGWSRRWAHDPTLTLPQSAFGATITAWGYLIDPPLRGAIIGIMLLNLVWGMFVLTRRQALALLVFALILLGMAMAYGALTDPEHFPPAIEALHFTFAATLMSAVSVLSLNMSDLRGRLRARSAELREALDRVQFLANHDELTRISNRRHLGERLSAERMRQGQTGLPIGLILIDIDHFKSVNDRHGHAAGDAVLRLFAATLQKSLRAGDFVGRWGGEEFLVVVPQQTDTGTAEALVQRLRDDLQKTSFDAATPGLRVTFSAGVSECAPGESLDAALERADRALYEAKEGGRNRTVSQFAPLV